MPKPFTARTWATPLTIGCFVLLDAASDLARLQQIGGAVLQLEVLVGEAVSSRITAPPVGRSTGITLEALIRAGDLAAALDLLRSGADANGHSAEGLAPLMIASGLGQSQLDAQGPYNGLTALHDAVWHGHLEAAQALVDAGARLNLTTCASGWRTHAGPSGKW